MVASAAATFSKSAPGTATYSSSSPNPVYTLLPMQPRLDTVPFSSDAGNAIQAGRPRGGSAPPDPARMAASFSNMAAEGRQAKSTTLGASGAAPQIRRAHL